MDATAISQYWALLVAAAIGLLVATYVAFSLRAQSAGGQLRQTLRDLARASDEHRKLALKLRRARRRLERLESRRDKVRPRHLDEARENVADGEALLKIADDQLLVKKNLVREVIVSEFPPSRHDELRSRYLGDTKSTGTRSP